MSTVGIELVNEIARVTSMRDDWQRQADMLPPAIAVGMRLSITVMTAEIEAAKGALHGGDPVAAIRAYESLKGYKND
jgi:hypothetical protein